MRAHGLMSDNESVDPDGFCVMEMGQAWRAAWVRLRGRKGAPGGQ